MAAAAATSAGQAPLNTVLGDMNNVIQAARVVPFKGYKGPLGVPEVINIAYDIWNLRITVTLSNLRGVIYVDFDSARGFRVLDEGDLLEMWVDRPKVQHWLNVVEANGWGAQEDQRPGFIFTASDQTEFLIVGTNDCVSVLAHEDPNVTIIDYDA